LGLSGQQIPREVEKGFLLKNEKVLVWIKVETLEKISILKFKLSRRAFFVQGKMPNPPERPFTSTFQFIK